MKKGLISSLLFLSVAVSSSWAQGEDTVFILKRAFMHSAAKREFLTRPFLNPALNYYRQSYSLSTLGAGGRWDGQSRAIVAELGDGWKGFLVAGDSYVCTSEKSRIWGDAYYRNGTRRNVQWNESSDYELLYPYVAADTIGGDMKSETYFFRGGYAAATGRWTFGGEFSYRAVQEFRDIDPRPNNKVADLQAKAGAAYGIMASYAVALSVEARKYKQNGSLAYYNELGVSKTFHLTGLGNSYTRFDGTRTNVRYQGHSYGAGVDLLPVQADGRWSGSFHYRYSFYEKMLPESNDLTLNELKENNLQGEVTRTFLRHARRFFGLKASVAYNERRGTENLYGDAMNHIYPQISAAEQFGSKALHATVSGSYEQEQTEKWRWSLQPAIGYLQQKDTYKTPAKSMKYSLWSASLAFASTHKWNKTLLYARVYSIYQRKIDATLSIDGQTAHPYALTVLQQNLEMMSGSRTIYGISLRWSRYIGKNLGYAEVGWQHALYANHEKNRSFQAGIGVYL